MKYFYSFLFLLVITIVAPAAAQQPSAEAGQTATEATAPPPSEAQQPPPVVEENVDQPPGAMDEVMVNRFLDRVEVMITRPVESISSHLTILEIFLSAVVALAGFFVVFFQLRLDRNMDKIWNEWKQSQESAWAAQKTTQEMKFQQFREKWNRSLESKVAPHLETLLESKHLPEFRASIDEQVRQTLGNTAAERGLLLARLRRFRDEVGACLEPIDAQAAECFRVHAAAAIQNWHTLGMLFSTVKDDVLKGLQEFNIMPFKEAISQLEKLKSEYRGDAQVLSEIDYALQALQQQPPAVVKSPQRKVAPQKKSTRRKRTPKRSPDDTAGS